MKENELPAGKALSRSEVINLAYPVSRVLLSPNKKGLLVERVSLGEYRSQNQPKRGEITMLSRQSLHRLAFLVTTSPVEFASMQTLTYGREFPRCGKKVKGDLNRFLNWLRSSYQKPEYVWFLEFQRRGAPHIHILLSLTQPEKARRERAAQVWSKIIATKNKRNDAKVLAFHTFDGHERGRMWQKTRTARGLVRYAIKYATKPEQKKVPRSFQNVGRFWGASKGVRVKRKEFTEIDVTEDWAREIIAKLGREEVSRWEVLPKHIYIDADEEIVLSEMEKYRSD